MIFLDSSAIIAYKNADDVNQMFIKELLKYAPKREYKKVYSIIILEAYKEQTRERQNEKAYH